MPWLFYGSKVARAARAHTVEQASCTPCWWSLRDASCCQPLSPGETCRQPQAVDGLAGPRVPSSPRCGARITAKTRGVLHRAGSARVALVSTACPSHSAGLTLVASPTIHHVVVYV